MKKKPCIFINHKVWCVMKDGRTILSRTDLPFAEALAWAKGLTTLSLVATVTITNEALTS